MLFDNRFVGLSALLLILLSPVSHSAVIQGKVYDKDYNLLPRAKVYINTVPIQILVTENGSYSFNVRDGKYTLSATYKDELYARHEVVIHDNMSTSYLDLVLEPRKGMLTAFYVVILGLLIFLLIAFFWVYLKRRNIARETATKFGLREDLQQLVSFLEKNNGRASQNEIVKELYLSKAKVSLMLTELEDKDVVKKIKRGRGNIVILKQRG